jgi:hypothetical protein
MSTAVIFGLTIVILLVAFIRAAAVLMRGVSMLATVSSERGPHPGPLQQLRRHLGVLSAPFTCFLKGESGHAPDLVL